VFNEIGHLPAALCHWQYGMFHLYRVNPPLPRMVAVVPLLLYGVQTDWRNYGMDPFSREEIPIGIRFANANGKGVFWEFTVARWACIPFSLLGAWICCRWAAELWHPASGVLACALWCFSPSILGNGALVMPDVPAAAVGLTATYLFWRWLQMPTWLGAFLTGSALGLAELCKTTLLVFFAIWPILWLASTLLPAHQRSLRRSLHEAVMMGAMAIVAVFFLNLGYGFCGSFQRLGQFRFASQLLGGCREEGRNTPGNRFANTWLGLMPVPVPGDYLQGIDRQETDFELGSRSYIAGRWKARGWWYYYLYALAIKTPLGTWALSLLAVGVSLFRRGYSAPWRDEMFLLLPAIAILTLVSSQTGFSMHSRYVLPILPFVFVWISKVERCIKLRHWKLTAIAGLALCWSVGGSLAYYPHSLSYFNELAGGPKNGHYHLLDSNIAWGQDLLFLRDWLASKPEARPVGLASFGWIHPELAGISFIRPPLGPRNCSDVASIPRPSDAGPKPGWYAIDVNFLHGTHWPAADPGGGWADIPVDGPNYEYFLRFEPVAMAGYSIYIYHITPEEANRVRREVGLKALSSSDSKCDNGDEGSEP